MYFKNFKSEKSTKFYNNKQICVNFCEYVSVHTHYFCVHTA